MSGQGGEATARAIRQQIEALQRWDIRENDGIASRALIEAATYMARVERLIRERPRAPHGPPLKQESRQ